MEFSISDERLKEKAEVLKPVASGLPNAACGPNPANPDWSEFLSKATAAWNGDNVSQQVVDKLHAEWETLAHVESIPRFQRRHEAGGVFDTCQRTLQQALVTKKTVKPTPSLAAHVLYRTLMSATRESNDIIWLQITNTLTSPKRKNGLKHT